MIVEDGGAGRAGAHGGEPDVFFCQAAAAGHVDAVFKPSDTALSGIRRDAVVDAIVREQETVAARSAGSRERRIVFISCYACLRRLIMDPATASEAPLPPRRVRISA